MSQWRLRWAYKSDVGGPWKAGETVELDEALAEFINRDSPGVLEAAEEPQTAEAVSHEQAEEGKQDRMMKGRRKR